MKNFNTLLFWLAANVCSAQFTDDFSDGDFTSNPPWVGSTSVFQINGSGQLQLNNSVAGTSHLSTALPSTALGAYSWEFFVRLNFASSGTNFGRVYLVSDQPDLNSPLNGYYLQLGEANSNDAIELFRQTGTQRTPLVRGTAAAIASAFAIRIRVTRSVMGHWTIYADHTGGTNFIKEAEATDATHTTSTHMGVLCVYTVSNSKNFFFDDFIVTGTPAPDTTPPTLQTITVASQQLTLTFNEPLAPASSTNVSHYLVNNNVGNPASALLEPDGKTVTLQFNEPFANGLLHQLDITGVADLAGNTISTASTTFRFFQPQPAAYHDLVINEILADPNPLVGLPEAEFVELYNRSSKAFHLSGWKWQDATTTALLPSIYLLPGEYLILCPSTAATSYASHGLTVGLTNFPTLNNAGDALRLVDDTGLLLDSVNYRSSWYQDEDKAQGGFSLERLNPEAPSNDSTNWMASEDASGGTPGKPNSVLGRNPDSKAPALVSIAAGSNHLLLTFSEAVTVKTATFQVVDGFAPAGVAVDSEKITLTFEQAFTNGRLYQLTIAGLTDLAGNVWVGNPVPFRHFQPMPLVPGAVVITEIMADPSPVVQLPEAEYIEIANVSSHPYDLQGWRLADATDTTSLPSHFLLPGEWLVLCATTQVARFAPYGKVLGVPRFPSLNNTGEGLALFAPDGTLADSVRYAASWYQHNEKKDGGWSLERLRSAEPSNNVRNWWASEDARGGTPGSVNSVWGWPLDRQPPVWLSVSALDATRVALVFDEPIDATALAAIRAELQPGSLLPTNVHLADLHTLILTFESPFTNGHTYHLQISHVQDLTGNALASAEKSFRYFVPSPVQRKDIIFTEVMADPTPVVQLPEAEYLELYNRSAHPIDLQGWTLTDGGTPAIFPHHIVMPGEYRLITATSQAPHFAPYGPVLAVANFPSLNNSGESLRLKDASGATIDSINYALSWYRSSDKQEGGWALELIDPNNPCGEEDNWTASEDERGGTPAARNAVHASKPDLTGPQLRSAWPLDAYTLQLSFNEPLQRSLQPAFFTISPAITIEQVRFADVALRTCHLLLAEPLQPRTAYAIKVQQLTDCNGNAVQPEAASAAFALPEAALPGDVVINEILFNPPPGGTDFVELLNHSPRYINLQGWTLGGRLIAGSPLLLAPGALRVLTADAAALQHQYPAMPLETVLPMSMPALPDAEGAASLHDAAGQRIDSLYYTADMHHALLNNPKGVSLERIAPEAPTHLRSNWISAPATAGYGTPGQLNASRRTSDHVAAAVQVQPQVLAPQAGTAFAQISYQLDCTGCLGSVRIIDAQGRPVKEIAANELLAPTGFFRWEGDQDDGTRARSGYYLVWFQVWDAAGNLRHYRERVVVANP
jgi:hypothetical protein